MPSLQFKGKNIIWNHHQSPLLPTHTLDLSNKLSYNPKNANGNLIVEGDNLLALKALLPEYQGKVDCIYIDPPYNTGNEGWVYNDKVNSPMINDWIGQTVGKEAEDFTRHDKWLCMMTPRLKLLHEMLSDKGVIFVSIDDNEVHHLRMLMNEIWGEENFVSEFVWRKSDNQANIGNMARVKEYILCFTKNISTLNFNKISLSDKAINEYRYSDENGKFRRNILFHKTRGRHVYDIQTPSGKILKGPWMIKEDKFLELIKNKGVYWTKGGDEQAYGKIYLNESKGQIPNDLLGLEVGSNQQASNELEKLFGTRVFDFSKPHTLIQHFLKISTNPDSIILDSFAGSGTTAQAVLELNKEDGGNRRFVLVQMPEEVKLETPAGKYCVDNNLPLKISSITRERVRLAIQKKINPAVVDSGALEGLETTPKEIGFEYYNLGTPLDSWSIISGRSNEELPTFSKLGGHIWQTLTRSKKTIDNSKFVDLDKYYLGDYKGEKVFMLYEADLVKLQGRELRISLPIAKQLEELYPNCPKLIYAPTCYLDDWHREKYQIRYINYPFGV